MNDQQFEPYEITPDNNPRVAYGVLEKAYKEVEAERDRLARDNDRLRDTLGACGRQATFGLKILNRVLSGDDHDATSRLKSRLMTIKTRAEAALRGEGADDAG